MIESFEFVSVIPSHFSKYNARFYLKPSIYNGVRRGKEAPAVGANVATIPQGM